MLEVELGSKREAIYYDGGTLAKFHIVWGSNNLLLDRFNTKIDVEQSDTQSWLCLGC